MLDYGLTPRSDVASESSPILSRVYGVVGTPQALHPDRARADGCLVHGGATAAARSCFGELIGRAPALHKEVRTDQGAVYDLFGDDVLAVDLTIPRRIQIERAAAEIR